MPTTEDRTKDEESPEKDTEEQPQCGRTRPQGSADLGEPSATQVRQQFTKWDGDKPAKPEKEELPEWYPSKPVGTYRHVDGVPTDIALYNRHCFDDDACDVDLDEEPEYPPSLAGRDEIANDDDEIEGYDISSVDQSGSESNDELSTDIVTEDGVVTDHGQSSSANNEFEELTDSIVTQYPKTQPWVDPDEEQRVEKARNDSDDTNLPVYPRTSLRARNGHKRGRDGYKNKLSDEQQEMADKLYAYQHEYYSKLPLSNELAQVDKNRMSNRNRTEDRIRPIEAMSKDILGKGYVDDVFEDYCELLTNAGTLKAMSTEEITLALCVLYELQSVTDMATQPEPTGGPVPADGGNRALFAYMRLNERIDEIVEVWCPVKTPTYQTSINPAKSRQTRLKTCTKEICEQLGYELPPFVSARELWPTE